jgi:acyl dehydratase
MPPLEIDHLSKLKEFEGCEAPPTDWFVVTQDRIQKFADAIEDRQWIHVDAERAARESPYGGTVAHGFLTLSLFSHLFAQSIHIREGISMGINYGLNRVRFPSAVRAGSAIRGRVTVLAVKESAECVDATYAVTIECRDAQKPCCIAECLARYYRS